MSKIGKRKRRHSQARLLRQSVNRLSILLEITRLMAAEVSLDELLRLIVHKTSDLVDAERSTLWLVDRQAGEIWAKVAQKAEVAEIRLRIDGPGLAAYVARTGETVNIADAYGDPRFNPEIDRQTHWHTPDMLVMPIRSRENDIIGVLQVLNNRHGTFGADDEELLASVCASAAIALQNAQFYQEQEHCIEKLKEEYNALRIEIDEVKMERQVAAITETEYFQTLRARVQQLRKGKQGAEGKLPPEH